jgi:steroid delta-isomerase-like uncharacterized protein
MDRATATDLIARYYACFNAGDSPGMLACLSPDVVHDINQGDRQEGLLAFGAFLERMNERYRETLRDISILASDDGRRASAEFIVDGTYLRTDHGLPDARGQDYSLPAGAFFALDRGRISRVTVYYNLTDWIRQIER